MQLMSWLRALLDKASHVHVVPPGGPAGPGRRRPSTASQGRAELAVATNSPDPPATIAIIAVRVADMSTVVGSPDYHYLLRNENGNCVEAFRRSMCRVNKVHYAEFERFRAFQRDFDGVSFSCQNPRLP